MELTKGERFNISQEAPNLKKMAIALGWQVTDAGQSYDIDVSAFMLGADGKIPNDQYFIFTIICNPLTVRYYNRFLTKTIQVKKTRLFTG